MTVKLDRDYEVKCTLGTIRDIETRFQKPFFSVLRELDKLTTTEQIKLLYCGALRADASLTEEAFVKACEDALGYGELAEYLEQFVLQLQYPGATSEEVRQKIEKKLAAAGPRRSPADSTGN